MKSRVLQSGSALAFAVVLLAGTSIHTAFAQAAAPQAPAAASLPTAKTIIDRHIEAVGGRQALSARNSVHTTGTTSIPANGLSGAVEIFAARPNKLLVKQTLTGIGEVLEGFDGTNAWSVNPMTGPTLAAGDELAQRALDADFESMLNAANRYTSMETLEKTKFDGRDCYKVKLVRKDGVEDFDYYDVSTGLKAGSMNTRKNPMGTMQITTTLTDYKKFGPILQPATITASVMGAQIITTITTVEYDNVEAAVFEPPAQIKALIKK